MDIEETKNSVSFFILGKFGMINKTTMTDITINAIKIFILGAMSFVLAFWLTPLLTHFLYKYKLWRKEIRTKSIDNKELVYFKQFHSEKETHVPRFGGLLIWISVSVLAIIFFLLSKTNIWWFQKLNFLSRSQTWIPFFALIAASLVGLLDDVLQVIGKGKYIAGGLKLKWRLIMVALIGLIGAWWSRSLERRHRGIGREHGLLGEFGGLYLRRTRSSSLSPISCCAGPRFPV